MGPVRGLPWASPRSGWNWARISVCGVIVLVLLIALGQGWWANSAHTQHAAVAAVRKIGGSVVYRYEISIAGTPFAPKWLVEWIGIDFVSSVFDVSFIQGGSDAEMVEVGHLEDLEKLWIAKSSVTDEGLRHLEGLHNLWDIRLAATKVSSAGMAHLRDLKDLKLLDLNDTNVGDDGLMEMRALTNLTSLGLSHTLITDAGLVHLKGLTKLQYLGLKGTNVTDAGLVHIKALRGVQMVNLEGTKVTRAGVQELRDALPGTAIYVSAP